MIDVLVALKKSGQVMSGDLAKKLGINERTLSVELYPHIVSGRVVSCRKLDAKGKFLGHEYRLSGTIPASRPGPKLKPRGF